jgi:hypothetical protein
MAYDNTNHIAIFVNEKRDKETSPLMTGTVNVEGVEYSVSLWGQTSKDGTKDFWSGKIQKKEPKTQTNACGLPPTGSGRMARPEVDPEDYTGDIEDDSIPF